MWNQLKGIEPSLLSTIIPKHLDYRAVQFAKDNGIILLTFPPHCSHVLQPCDGPFKRAFEKSQNDWLQSHPGQRISIREIAQLLAGPYLLAFTPKNIVSGFKLTGICAFHSHHHLSPIGLIWYSWLIPFDLISNQILLFFKIQLPKHR